MKVGTRIAVLAEPDDDLSTLSIPEEAPASATSKASSATTSSPQESTQSSVGKAKSSESQAEAPPSSKGLDTRSATTNPESSSSKSSSGISTTQKHPLTPSVAYLLHQKQVPTTEAAKIPASGPGGRLLKGDILAYFGTIAKSYPSEQSARLEKMEHLDLRNIRIVPPEQALTPPPSKAAPPQLDAEMDTKIEVSVSFKAVKEVQERMSNALGIDIPLETFVTRAIEISNMDLPRSKIAQPSADELFNQVLGLDNTSSKLSNGHFTPQIVALPLMSSSAILKASASQSDIIDILTGKTPSARRTPRTSIPKSLTGSSAASGVNVFSLSAPKGEEQRAKVFLERVKTVLQVDPGRLVL